jgi:hypothetical protein
MAAHDDVARFVAPRKPGAVNYTTAAADETGPSVEAPVRRLSTLWDRLGRRPIEVLKMDIEGGANMR